MKWIIAIFALLSSLIIASIAGWFSIVGMMALFGGSSVAAGIMMGSLEVGKIVTAAWLKNEWYESAAWLKYSLLAMVFVLMFITSMGIFGFLSKAHIEQGAPVGNTAAKIERIDERIAREQSKIDDSQIVLNQLDETVNTLIEYDRIRGAEGATAVRKSQQEQRNELTSDITIAEDKIDSMLDEKFELSQTIREYEVEVGPVKYIAEMIYSDTEGKLDAAVRAVIIILIFVFDPFAVILLVASNHSFMKLLKERKALQKSNISKPKVRPLKEVINELEEDPNFKAELDRAREKFREKKELEKVEKPVIKENKKSGMKVRKIKGNLDE